MRRVSPRPASRRDRHEIRDNGIAQKGLLPMSIVRSESAPRCAGRRSPRSAAQGGADATVVIVDSAGTVVSVNPDFERTAGYSRYEILGKPVAELQEGERDPLLFRLIEEAARRRRAGSEVFPRRGKDGPAGHETATVHPMCDALGRVTGCVAITYPLASGSSL